MSGGYKRRRNGVVLQDVDSVEHWRQLATSTARLALTSAASLRQVRAIIEHVLLLPSDHPCVKACHAASKDWHEHNQGNSAMGAPPYVAVFLALISSIANSPEVSDEVKKALLQYLQTSPEELILQIRQCRVSRCYDPNWNRIELAGEGQSISQVINIVVRLLIAAGAKLCHGAAPRTPLEREVSNLLHAS